jgi:TM2 domain-containing membrane protein YozV
MTETQPAMSYTNATLSSVTGDPRRKLPLLALMLSAMPGLGQIYVGYYQRGFIHAIVVGTLIALINYGVGPLEPLAALFLAFFWLYNIVDAGRRAMLYNEALAGRTGIELPEDFKTPGLQGSIPGGLAIVAVGGVLLSHTLFGVSLEWLNDWWPAALILFGVYLVARSAMSRAPATAKP